MKHLVFNENGFIFINKQNVKIQGDSVIVWEAIYSFSEGFSKHHLIIFQREYNCRENTVRVIYDGPDYKNQKMLHPGRGAVYKAAEPIIPNTASEVLLKYACSLRNNY